MDVIPAPKASIVDVFYMKTTMFLPYSAFPIHHMFELNWGGN